MARPEVFTDIDKWVDEVNKKPAASGTPNFQKTLHLGISPSTPVQAGETVEPDPDVKRLLEANRIMVNYGPSRVSNLEQHKARFKEIEDRCRQLRLQVSNSQAEIVRKVDEDYRPAVKAALAPNNGYDVELDEIESQIGIFKSRIKIMFKEDRFRAQLTEALRPLNLVSSTVYHYPHGLGTDPVEKRFAEAALRPSFSPETPGRGPAMPRLLVGTMIFVHIQDAEEYLRHIKSRRDNRSKKT